MGGYLLALRALADAIAGDVDPGRERAELALDIAARTNGRPRRALRARRSRPARAVGRQTGRGGAGAGPAGGVPARRGDRRAGHGPRRPRPGRGADRARRPGGGRRAAGLVRGERAAAAPAVRPGRRGPLPRAARRRGRGRGRRRDRAARRRRAARWCPDPLERARTELAYGSALRRSRQKAAARGALESACSGFEAIGARAWAARTRAELGRLGGRPPSSGALTPTEQRVAELVAQGLQTKQVAGRLFVSPKTVEGHLSRIYGKLGVSSRTELAHRLGERGD